MKTDALDAVMLAHFGEAIKPEVRPLPGEDEQELRGLIARQHQIVGMITSERNRLSKATKRVRPQIEEHTAWHQGRIGDLNKELDEFIQSSPLWLAKDDLLKSVPRRCGASHPRQRTVSWQTIGVRWEGVGTCYAVHGDACSYSTQSGHKGFLYPPV